MSTDIVSSVQEHATIMGSSSAERVINCPGSVRLQALSPKQPTSQAAADGTAQHAVTELILLNDGDGRDFIGANVDGVIIDDDKAVNINVAIASAKELLTDYPEWQLIEQRVTHTPVEAFGTADLLALSKDSRRLLVADHKFGYVEVKPDNYQGRFIAATAFHDHTPLDDSGASDAPTLAGLLIDVEEVELAIIQPSFEPAHTTKVFPRSEFETFRKTMDVAIAQAKSPNAPVKEGSWCKWCTASLICPAKLERGADLIDLKKHAAEWATNVPAILDAGEWFLPLHEQAKDRAKHELANGRKIKGWALGKARSRAKWIDAVASTVIAGLRGLGLKDKDILRPLTPAQARKMLTKDDTETAKLLEEMISVGHDEPPLVREGDPSAPAIPVAAIKRAAAAAGAPSGKR